MNQLARNLACEWASDNIRTNAICPWLITTPLISDVRTISLEQRRKKNKK
jgi:Tropinone reductase 1